MLRTKQQQVQTWGSPSMHDFSEASCGSSLSTFNPKPRRGVRSELLILFTPQVHPDPRDYRDFISHHLASSGLSWRRWRRTCVWEERLAREKTGPRVLQAGHESLWVPVRKGGEGGGVGRGWGRPACSLLTFMEYSKCSLRSWWSELPGLFTISLLKSVQTKVSFFPSYTTPW